MKTVKEASREIELLCEADVVVVGGGPAGIGAAISAGRNGAKTVLTEFFGCLGGSQTLSCNPQFSFVDRRIQGGILQEITDDLFRAKVVRNASPGQIRTHWGVLESGSYHFDPEFYKILLDQKMQEANVTVLFHTFAVAVIKEGRLVKGVVIESSQGRNAILAKSVIDCTGIGHLSRTAGASILPVGFPDETYGPFIGQRAGIGYGMYLDNVDYAKFRKFADENEEWDQFVCGTELFREKKAAGALYCKRDSCFQAQYSNGRVWLLAPNYIPRQGEEPWHVEVMSKAEIDLRKQAWSAYSVIKNNVPGFENSRIESTPVKMFMRDACRMEGEYVFKVEDMYCETPKEDAVACCNMPMDIFLPNGHSRFRFDVLPYDIPYGCLLSKDFDNLLAAGSSQSSDFYPWAATRYCAPSVCTGQAAGTAMAIAAKKGITPKQVDVKELQVLLKKQGLITSRALLDPEVMAEYRLRTKLWPKNELALN